MARQCDNARRSDVDPAVNRLMLAILIRHPHERRVGRCYDFAERHPHTLRGAVADVIGDQLDRRVCRWRKRNERRRVEEILAKHPKWRR
jgi:hypothetical protein